MLLEGTCYCTAHPTSVAICHLNEPSSGKVQLLVLEDSLFDDAHMRCEISKRVVSVFEDGG
jgi:hypothetical protein